MHVIRWVDGGSFSFVYFPCLSITIRWFVCVPLCDDTINACTSPRVVNELSHNTFTTKKMPPRISAPARERDYDYSNVGKVGRRTGVTLEPRPLDEHGLEEMTGLFSSPRKPSPVSSKRTVMASVEMPVNAATPRAALPSQGEFQLLSERSHEQED